MITQEELYKTVEKVLKSRLIYDNKQLIIDLPLFELSLNRNNKQPIEWYPRVNQVIYDGGIVSCNNRYQAPIRYRIVDNHELVNEKKHRPCQIL
jgi:hypothetical protein